MKKNRKDMLIESRGEKSNKDKDKTLTELQTDNKLKTDEIQQLIQENKELSQKLTKNLDNMNEKNETLLETKEELIKELQKKIEELEEKIKKMEEVKEKKLTIRDFLDINIRVFKNGLYLSKHNGELDIGEIERTKGRIKGVTCKENVKNFSVVNYTLPFAVQIAEWHGLEQLKDNINLNWLHDNKEVAFPFFHSSSLKEITGWENDKFLQKIFWNLISHRGRKILNADGIELLIDISDLDQIIDNYDYSRFAGMIEGKKEDIEHHQKLFGGKERFKKLYTAFDNLANKVLARNLIVLSRLLTSKEDLEAGKLKLYEEKINELGNGFQKCSRMFPGKPWTKEETQVIIDKALTPDYELLEKLADLPYISEWVKEQLSTTTNPQNQSQVLINNRAEATQQLAELTIQSETEQEVQTKTEIEITPYIIN